MKLFLESEVLRSDFDIRFLCTNVRKSNQHKGKFGTVMLLAWVVFFARLFWELCRYRPRLAYYPVTATQLGWVGRDAGCLLLCRILGVKTVIHLRASHFRLNFEQFRPFAKRLTALACRTVSRCIVQADYLHKQFEGLVPTDKMVTLYQGINTNDYDNPDLENYTAGKILFMGHLTKAKGYCDVLRAMPKVVEEFPESQFVFAGTIRRGERNVHFNQKTGDPLVYEDPFEREQAITSSILASNYSNVGIVHDDEKLALLRTCAVFILPSYSEGFSRAVVEAMSVGKPVVYTSVGAHREVFQHERDGLCVEPGDVDGIADAILRLVRDGDLRKRIGQANYARVRRDFDISVISKQLGKVFHQVLTA